MRVTAEAARRFLVARHFLAPARSLAGGLDGVLEVFRKLGSIQFDPIAVAGRNHDLVLHARVAGYEPAWCDALYERGDIVETTNKALSFVPTSEFPWFRVNGGRKGPRFHAAALADNAAVAERVLERIRTEGPLSSRDFERESGPTKDWFGMPENAVRAVLEAYTVAGVIGLARREGTLRYYDLLERLLPAEVLAHEVPEREQLLHKLLSRYRAHGLLGPGGAGGTFARIANPPERNALRKELVELGALVSVDVEGVRGKRLVLREELELLQAPPEPPPSVAFVAPFDSLLWDTALLASLFDFEYVWEGFFAPAKRRWGYYVLPIIFGDRFVGRIEPRIDLEDATVRVLTSGGRTASPRAAPAGSSTRCAMPSAPTYASQASAASIGRRSSPPRNDSSPRARNASPPLGGDSGFWITTASSAYPWLPMRRCCSSVLARVTPAAAKWRMIERPEQRVSSSASPPEPSADANGRTSGEGPPPRRRGSVPSAARATAFVVICVGLAVAAAAVALAFLPNRYSGEARIAVAPIAANDDTFLGVDVFRDPGFPGSSAYTVATLVKTPRVLRAAARRLGNRRRWRDPLGRGCHRGAAEQPRRRQGDGPVGSACGCDRKRGSPRVPLGARRRLPRQSLEDRRLAAGQGAGVGSRSNALGSRGSRRTYCRAPAAPALRRSHRFAGYTCGVRRGRRPRAVV